MEAQRSKTRPAHPADTTTTVLLLREHAQETRERIGQQVRLFHLRLGKRKPGCPKLVFHQCTAGVISEVYPRTNARRDTKHGTRQDGVKKTRDGLRCSWLMMMMNIY